VEDRERARQLNDDARGLRRVTPVEHPPVPERVVHDQHAARPQLPLDHGQGVRVRLLVDVAEDQVERVLGPAQRLHRLAHLEADNAVETEPCEVVAGARREGRGEGATGSG
jgi:hypothetical protein